MAIYMLLLLVLFLLVYLFYAVVNPASFSGIRKRSGFLGEAYDLTVLAPNRSDVSDRGGSKHSGGTLSRYRRYRAEQQTRPRLRPHR